MRIQVWKEAGQWLMPAVGVPTQRIRVALERVAADLGIRIDHIEITVDAPAASLSP